MYIERFSFFMCERAIVAQCQMSYIPALSWREQVIFDEMMMMIFALYTLNWIFIVLDYWYNSLQVELSLHSVTLTGFQANQFLLLLLNAVYLMDQFYSLWFDTNRLKLNTLSLFVWWCLTPLSTIFQLYRGVHYFIKEVDIIGLLIQAFLMVNK
jgi:hypothetical protein